MRWAPLGLLLVALPAAARQLPAPTRAAHVDHPATASIAPTLSPPGETPEERLARARQAYLNNDFDNTIAAAHDLLYPEVKLSSEEDVQTAHRLLALSLFLNKQEDAAEREFTALLSLRPEFALDPVVDPPRAIKFLDDVKRNQRLRIEEIEVRRREEIEAAARDEEKRRKEDEDRRVREAVDRVRRELKPVVIENHSRVVSLMPFGAGQLQNDERGKAAAFLSTQVAFGATSAALWLAIEVKYDFGKTKVPAAEVPQAQAIQVASLVTGGLFWGDVLWGIIDASVHYKSQVTRAAPLTPPAPRVSIRLSLPAGGGAGLSLQGAF